MPEQLCMFCDADMAHAWHDDGEFNQSHDLGNHEPPAQESSKDLLYYKFNHLKRGLAAHKLASGTSQIPTGDARFHALLQQIGELHDAKQQDYGSNADAFANVRAAEEWGISPWIGAMIRATDKVRRLQTFAAKGSLINEGVEDSLMDLAVYSLIALILFREEQR